MDFYADPWATYDSPLSDSYTDWVPEVIADETPSYMQTPSYSTAMSNASETSYSNPVSSSGYQIPAFSPAGFLDGLKSITDYGLKVSGTLFAANSAAKDQQLNSYLKRSQVDIFQTQAKSAQQVAGLNAQTQANLGQMRINAANTGAVGANLGTAVGNNSLMLWLTIAGVAFAFIQVLNSSK